MAIYSIKGACDLHIHSSPDIFERLANDIETAEACRDAGMRAIVFKCHADTTMTRAWHTSQAVPEIKTFGGVVLNLHTGGINPAAVDVALKLGAVEVWMPTYHSLAHYKETGKMGGYAHMGADARQEYEVKPITILDGNDNLIPEIEPILKLVKKHNAILGTSHLSAHEALKLIEAGHDMGLERMLLTHRGYQKSRGAGRLRGILRGQRPQRHPQAHFPGSVQGGHRGRGHRAVHHLQRLRPSPQDPAARDPADVRPRAAVQGRSCEGYRRHAEGQLRQTAGPQLNI